MNKIILPCKKIVGPNGNWWIDDEGNMYLKGNLVVEGGLDPTYFQCDPQAGVPAVANILMVDSNDVYKFKYRDNSTAKKVQVGDSIVVPVGCDGTDTDTDVAPAQEPTWTSLVSTTVSITAGHEAVVFGGYVWSGLSSESIGLTQENLLVDVTAIGSGGNTSGGGGFMRVDLVPGTTYTATVAKGNVSTYAVFGGSIVVMEVSA